MQQFANVLTKVHHVADKNKGKSKLSVPDGTCHTYERILHRSNAGISICEPALGQQRAAYVSTNDNHVAVNEKGKSKMAFSSKETPKWKLFENNSNEGPVDNCYDLPMFRLLQQMVGSLNLCPKLLLGSRSYKYLNRLW